MTLENNRHNYIKEFKLTNELIAKAKEEEIIGDCKMLLEASYPQNSFQNS
jgi:hypothetical protein